MLIRTVYLVCQLSDPLHFQPKLLEGWPLSANDAILQIDTLDNGMEQLLPQVLRRFENVTLQYFTMNVNVSGERRQFLLSLEDMGINVEIRPEPLVGMSLYAAVRRYKYRIPRADHALIVYDKMNRAIRGAISSAKTSGCDAYILCCGQDGKGKEGQHENHSKVHD